MKRKKGMSLLLVSALFLLIFLWIEIKPATVASSTIYTTADQTEVKMYVIANTLLPIDKEKLAEEILSEYWKINGKRENESYTMVLYRTMIHFRGSREYNTVSCDNNGEIINGGL